MDGRDLGALEHLEGPGAAMALRLGARGVGPHPLQALPEPELESGGRVFGEGDGGDLLETGMAARDEPLHAVHEQGGLARARSRLEHQARAVVAAGSLASLLVDGAEGGGHRMALRSRARRRFRSPSL